MTRAAAAAQSSGTAAVAALLLDTLQSFHTFTTKGEYFFNDPFCARPTGKIEVY